MKATVTVSRTVGIEKVPETCHVCPFSDICDLFVGKLTKSDGIEWTKSAMTRRLRKCPMKIEEE